MVAEFGPASLSCKNGSEKDGWVGCSVHGLEVYQKAVWFTATL